MKKLIIVLTVSLGLMMSTGMVSAANNPFGAIASACVDETLTLLELRDFCEGLLGFTPTTVTQCFSDKSQIDNGRKPFGTPNSWCDLGDCSEGDLRINCTWHTNEFN